MASWIEGLSKKIDDKEESARRNILLLERRNEVAPMLLERLIEAIERDVEECRVALKDDAIQCHREGNVFVVERKPFPSFRLELNLRGSVISVKGTETRSFSSTPASVGCTHVEVGVGALPDEYYYLVGGARVHTAQEASEWILRTPLAHSVEYRAV